MNSTPDGADNDDLASSTWIPPTEAERKVIEAKRERSNKISSLMGQYLLKGYKMLAITCPHCDCILLEDRHKNKYCIACSEVDADTKKDNPAVSEHAARRTVEESQHRLSRAEDEEDTPLTAFASSSTHLASSSDAAVVATPILTCPHRYERQVSSDSLKQQTSDAVHSATSVVSTPRQETKNNPPEVGQAHCVLRQKLGWATCQLQAATNIQECQHLVKLISEIMAALSSIRHFKSSDGF